jgi:hypothetical protein
MACQHTIKQGFLAQRTEQGLQNFPRFSRKTYIEKIQGVKVNKKVEQSANAIMNNLPDFLIFSKPDLPFALNLFS